MEDLHSSSMSNFAATSGPFSQRLSPVNQATSEIIDAFSNTYYGFWDVYVKFSKLFSLCFLRLEAGSSFEGFLPSRKICRSRGAMRSRSLPSSYTPPSR